MGYIKYRKYKIEESPILLSVNHIVFFLAHLDVNPSEDLTEPDPLTLSGMLKHPWSKHSPNCHIHQIISHFEHKFFHKNEF